jgi:hypothetical protein
MEKEVEVGGGLMGNFEYEVGKTRVLAIGAKLQVLSGEKRGPLGVSLWERRCKLMGSMLMSGSVVLVQSQRQSARSAIV